MNAARNQRRNSLADLDAADEMPEPSSSPAAGSDDESEDSAIVRVSLIDCLINTNVAGGWPAVVELERYLKTHLFKAQTLERVIPIESGRPDRDILVVEIQAPSIEEGPRRGFIHAHFILRIVHATRVILGLMAPNMQEDVRENSIFGGAFVSCRLLNAAPENYSLKGVTREAFLRTNLRT